MSEGESDGCGGLSAEALVGSINPSIMLLLVVSSIGSHPKHLHHYSIYLTNSTGPSCLLISSNRKDGFR